jgi:hypothetical protein
MVRSSAPAEGYPNWRGVQCRGRNYTGRMGATETVDLFMELINDDRREDAVALFAEHAVLGISVPGSDERTNLRGRDKVGGWFVRAGDGFRMYANEGRSMGASYIADVTVMRPGRGGGPASCSSASERSEAATNGGRPVSISNRTTPSPYRSDRGLTLSPASCSGER